MVNVQKKQAMQNNKIYIQERIPKDSYDPDGSMDLDNTYGQAVSELGLQQSKRDQIIAFYLTILGLVAPSVIGMDVSDLALYRRCFLPCNSEIQNIQRGILDSMSCYHAAVQYQEAGY